MTSSDDLKDDEYIKDNIIYCKKCNTPRSKYFEEFKKMAYGRCKCQKEADDKEEADNLKKERFIIFNKLFDNSLIGNRYKKVSFDSTNLDETSEDFKKAFSRCKKYVSNFDSLTENGESIYLFGDCGTGKTHLAMCIANYLLNKFRTVLFTNFSDIAKNIINSKDDYLGRISTVDLLIIDDVGTQIVQKNGGDNWLQEKVYEVINNRYNVKKPAIFTSNDSLSDLIDVRSYLKKTVDRIAEMSAAVIKLTGKSYRLRPNKEEKF